MTEKLVFNYVRKALNLVVEAPERVSATLNVREIRANMQISSPVFSIIQPVGSVGKGVTRI